MCAPLARFCIFFTALVLFYVSATVSHADDMVQASESQLLSAIEKEDVPKVRALLSSGADANTKDSSGNPALWHAIGIKPHLESNTPVWHIDHKRVEMVHLLLDHGADPNGKNMDGTLVLSADPFLPVAVTRLLLRKGADPNHLPGLLYAGSVTNAMAVLEAGAPVNIKMRIGLTPLILAAGLRPDSGLPVKPERLESEYEALVLAMLHRGADLDAHTGDGTNPLMFAAGKGYTGIVRILLNAGAKVDVRDNWGDTALTSAAHLGKQHPSVRALLQHGAIIGPKDALLMRDMTVFNSLLDRGVDVNQTGFQGENLLTIAAKQADVETVRKLLQLGFKVDGVGEISPLIQAIGRHWPPALPGETEMSADEADRRYRTVELLVEKGANVNAICFVSGSLLGPDHRRTALWLALQNQATEIAHLLIEHGASQQVPVSKEALERSDQK